MRHPYFHKAVMEAYNHLIPSDEQVSYFIYFEVDPANIDVNIHPTKTEIKFENESAIWQILLAAVKESLGKFNEVPTIDFDTEGMPEIPVYEKGQPEQNEMPKVNVNKDYNPFEKTESYNRTKIDWEALYGGLEKPSSSIDSVTMASGHEPADSSLYNDANEHSQSIEQLQIKGRYILSSVKTGLMVIDQRRAHIRILYERYMKQEKDKSGASQRVLFPDVLQFSPSEEEVLKQMMDDLSNIGFDLADLGGGSYSINATPVDVQGLKLSDMLHGMISLTLEAGKSMKEEISHNIALSLAQHAAVVYGQALSPVEMSTLIDDLFACSNANITPDGRIIYTIIKEEEIEKRF
jgi:DNA mismatch repair protein MutL